ncbi:MAG: cell division protein FtsZ, partial [Lachnospiraceae bacterium]|nr:cell division protein FtsZ [Lachnospiraceae bacterium]
VMKDKGIAHIGIGEGKGDDKAMDAVKKAVESPLLETTISGATDIIINVSGDITLADANDAASYVEQLAGEDINVILGAMYDDSKSDSCTITVIATGLDDVPNSAPQSRLGAGLNYKNPVNSLKNFNVQQGTSGVGTAGNSTPVKPLTGINRPVDIRSNVEEKSLNIPSFLQRK